MCKFVSYLALILIIIGALNWGLWGFFQFDLVAWIFGGNTMMGARVVYGIIGLAGLWSLCFLGKCCAMCCDTKHHKKK
jgi:uncharacterized protein